MLTKSEFRDVLQRLLEKSRKDQVQWQPIPGLFVRTHFNSAALSTTFAESDAQTHMKYQVEFEDGSRIYVESDSPDAAPDWASAELIVGNRRVIGMQAEDGDQTGDFELLNSLVLEAGRHVEGWDKALQKIVRRLNSDEPVGTAATSG